MSLILRHFIFLLFATIAAVTAGCSDETASTAPDVTAHHTISPNFWTWKANHLGKVHDAYALFDMHSQPATLIVGHVPWQSNLPAYVYAFEVTPNNDTLNISSLGAFQPHANCIHGEFEFVIESCDPNPLFNACAALFDTESGREKTVRAYDTFNVDFPENWTKGQFGAKSLDGPISDYLDMSALFADMNDQTYIERRTQSASRFLQNAFNLRAELPDRLRSTAVKNRQCEDSGIGIINALSGTRNTSFISTRLPE